jgi:negative regulator of flagellin synthesis FlgM
MQIYGPSQLHGAQPINAAHGARPSQAPARTESAAIHDEVNISDAARLAEQINDLPDIRQDRVDAVRQQIAAGTYETNEKMEMALDRLLDEIG